MKRWSKKKRERMRWRQHGPREGEEMNEGRVGIEQPNEEEQGWEGGNPEIVATQSTATEDSGGRQKNKKKRERRKRKTEQDNKDNET